MGSRRYSTPVDIWSIGCIFAEMVNGRPLITGTSEADQLDRIFRMFGTPTEMEYPGIVALPDYTPEFPCYPKPRLGIGGLVPSLDSTGLDLFGKMMMYDPSKRITAQEALSHVFFVDLIGSINSRGR